jgi:phosphatidate cytidylyltransferase
VALWGLLVAAALPRSVWPLFAIVAGFGFVGLREYLRALASSVPQVMRAWVALIGVLYAIAWAATLARPEGPDPALIDTGAALLLLAGLSILAMVKAPDGRETLWAIFAAGFGFLYVPFLLSFFIRLLIWPQAGGNAPLPGLFYVLHVIAVTKFTDMGAYLVGSLFGRRRMIPHLSPGKTWEGLAGAMAGAFVASHAVVALWPGQVPLLNHGHAAVLALLLGAMATIGDLAESLLKRCLAVKDSGNSLPGIGGGLDLIDSLLFTAPAAWLYLHLLVK